MEGRVVTRLQKWGNGLGLRVPKSLAAEAKVARRDVHREVDSGASRGREAC